MSRGVVLYCKENIPTSKISQGFLLMWAPGHAWRPSLAAGVVPSWPADTRWKPWVAVPLQLLTAGRRGLELSERRAFHFLPAFTC